MPSLRPLALLISAAVAVSGAMSLAPVQAASSASSSTYLCTGYTSCAKAGYSSSGYASANNKMYWRMYAGHNCTNYAAYRMIQNGYSATRPWSSGSGSAYNWGVAMKSITNTTPTVGAVAWWPANAPGAGSSGHVAYVEKVVSSTEIIISEDMWGGDFHWRDIKIGDRWPKGFVHFNDQALISTDRPVISGTPQVGSPLSATTGIWPIAPSSYLYQWRATGQPIDGASGPTFTPTAAELGKKISVRVTGSKSGYASGYSYSHRGAVVAPGLLTQTAAPSITGEAIAGSTVTAQPGQWSPTPSSLSVQWYADGKAISGAVDSTLKLGPSQAGTKLTAVTTAARDGYTTATATSAAVGPVLAGKVVLTKPFTLSGTDRVGQTLSVAPGTYTPANATVTYQWRRDGKAIGGANEVSRRITADDLGARLSVRMTVGSPGYLGRTTTLTAPGVTTTKPVVSFSAAGKPGRAVVKVRVTAPGLSGPSGKVTVKVGLRSATASLVKGKATVQVTGLTAGQRKVRVYYLGSGWVERASARGDVHLPRR